MRKLVVIIMLALGSAAHAAQCVTVTSSQRAEADAIRSVVLDAFRSTERSCIDVAVIELRVAAIAGDNIEVTAQLRVAISDDRGHMRSVMSGGARLVTSRRSSRRIARLRAEVAADAMRGMVAPVRAQL